MMEQPSPERVALLQAFVEEVDGVEVAWGRDDCCAWPAKWVEAASGVPVKLPLYGSEEQAHALIDEAGGLVVLWARALARAGIYETPYEPQLGDIGIVSTSRYGDVGVIFAQDGMALWRAASGTAVIRPRARSIVKVWRVP